MFGIGSAWRRRGQACGDLPGDRRAESARALWPAAGDAARACVADVLVSRELLSGQGFDFPGEVALEYAVGSDPISVAAADLDGDDKVDLVTANSSSSGTVSVLLNNGDGTFAARVTYAVGRYPRSVATADLDGDGKPDLVTANLESTTVSVLHNNGSGTFGPQVTYAVGDAPTSVAAADVDGDGKADLVTANSGSNTVSVLRNNGDGTFAAQVTYAVGSAPQSVAAGDLNGDGNVDLVTANIGAFPHAGTVSVLLSNGDGTFGARVTYAVGRHPNAVAAADADGDGKAELVTANGGTYPSDPGTVSVLRNNGDGTFADQITHPMGSKPRSVAAADVSGDGMADLVTANLNSNTVSVLRSNGDGAFAAQVTYPVGSSPTSVAAADVDGDGMVDLVTANYSSNTVSVLLNTGTGPAIGDATGDGRIDADDYARIDAGFLRRLTGWANGDFNRDGGIDAADYYLIDRACATQGGAPAAEGGALAAAAAAAASSPVPATPEASQPDDEWLAPMVPAARGDLFGPVAEGDDDEDAYAGLFGAAEVPVEPMA